MTSNGGNVRYNQEGECIGFIEDGDWAQYDTDFGESTEHVEFRIASQT
jgi:hypothetical protein